MGRVCIVEGCTSTFSTTSDVTFHKLKVSDPIKYQEWLTTISDMNKQPGIFEHPNSANICSKHFTKDCYIPNGMKRYLSKDACPSIFPRDNDRTDIEFHELRRPLAPLEFNRSELPRNEQTPLPSTSAMTLQNPPTTPKRAVRYVGDIPDNIQTATPNTMVRYVAILKKQIKAKNRVVKRLRTNAIRQKNRISKLVDVIKNLRQKNYITESAEEVLNTISHNEKNLLAAINRGKIRGCYPPELRTFALTLHFYSPRAYQYVRSLYKTNLPAPSTIRGWYSHTNGSPGFTTDALQVLKLKKKMAEEKGKQLVACLMVDEMAVRKQFEWSHHQNKYVGVVDFGADLQETEQLPVAKDALVFLLTGVNERWKIPVGYFLVNGLSSTERANITKEMLNFLHPSGVIIIGLTFDGHPANMGMCNHLGANVWEGMPFFKHPIDGHIIYILLDACHCLKLIRNTLASKGQFYDNNQEKIQWKYITNLVAYQETIGMHLANKLNQKHVMWNKNIMNVKIAAQTLSESTSISLQQLLNEHHPDFQGSQATINFIVRINNIFDCLNSRSLFAFGYKKAITKNNYISIFKFFEESIKYIEELKLENKEYIINSRSNTGFLRFIIAMKNFKTIFTEYVLEKNILDYILSYKFSQDHLLTKNAHS